MQQMQQSAAAFSRANREKLYQREPRSQRCRTNIIPAVSLKKKKEAVIGRAAGEPNRPLKKLNQACDPRGLVTRDQARLIAANVAKLERGKL